MVLAVVSFVFLVAYDPIWWQRGAPTRLRTWRSCDSLATRG